MPLRGRARHAHVREAQDLRAQLERQVLVREPPARRGEQRVQLRGARAAVLVRHVARGEDGAAAEAAVLEPVVLDFLRAFVVVVDEEEAEL